MPRGDFEIEARGLRKRFGSFAALKGVTLEVEKGRFLCVFGPNGAGKSTLLSILATFMKPSGGEAFVGGFDVLRERSKVRKLAGFISHHTMLYENLTALENLRFIGAFYDTPDLEDRCSDILRKVGLYSKKNSPVSSLSFGMRKRLAIARTLIHDPGIFFLDEPYSGLDYSGAAMLTSILESVKEDKTVIMTTHNVYEGLSLCDKVAILNRGEVVYSCQSNPGSLEFQKIYASRIANEDAR